MEGARLAKRSGSDTLPRGVFRIHCPKARQLAFTGVLFALLSAACPAEERTVYTTLSPNWLAAVGKLDVPGSRYQDGRHSHHREGCSGTLLARAPGLRADIVLTAWHCLEYYNDLSRAIVFTLRPDSGNAVSREAYRVADGGGMHADWALLKLYRPVEAADVAGLMPHPGRADAGLPITMAGYSGDDGLGAGGDTLTYHSQCRITRQDSRESESNCQAYKGASGGAVIQLSAEGQAQVTGVISRGDSESLSIYVPVAGFRGPLNRYLK
jgi:trypsin-like peptidase